MQKNVTYNTKLGFLGSDEETIVRAYWEPGNVDLIAEILVQVALGNIFPILFEEVERFGKSIGDEEGLEKIKSHIKDRIAESNQQKVEDEVVVQPINAIKHMISLYQG